MANRMAGKELYRWWLLSPDDQPVEASNGIAITPTSRLSDTIQFDTLIVVAGIDAERQCNSDTKRWLRRHAENGVTMGATSVGTVFLAQSGLLNGYRCTIHWEHIDGFREEFPSLNVTDELYEIDGRRITCSGGSAGLDMMMNLIEQRHGHNLATSVAEQCIHPEIRKSQASQRLSLRNRLNVTNPRLLNAIESMQRHIEDTLNCDQIASQAGLSIRQLDRLFKENIGVTPARFYMDLRLKRANALLTQSAITLTEVQMACGFLTRSHFIRCYREKFGYPPSVERSREVIRNTSPASEG